MPDQIEALKRLQEIDATIFEFRREQEEKPEELNRLEQDMAAQEAAVMRAEEEVKALIVAQKEKEVELQSCEANVKKLQGQLSLVKTNREYTAMQHEIDSLRADNSFLEETVIKMFDEIDQKTKVRDEKRQHLAREKERMSATRNRIEEELGEIEEKLSRLQRERQGAATQVPPSALGTYERVLKNRKGSALVPVVNESCGGCDRRLPPQVINEVYLQAKLVMCESCGRILYFDETRSKL